MESKKPEEQVNYYELVEENEELKKTNRAS
jgi:hypothetical protein